MSERSARLRLRRHGFFKIEGGSPAATHAARLGASFMKKVATRRLRHLRGAKLRLAAVLSCAIAVHLRGIHSFGVCSYRSAATSAAAAAAAAAAAGRLHRAAAGSIAGGGRCSSCPARHVRWRTATRANRRYVVAGTGQFLSVDGPHDHDPRTAMLDYRYTAPAVRCNYSIR